MPSQASSPAVIAGFVIAVTLLFAIGWWLGEKRRSPAAPTTAWLSLLPDAAILLDASNRVQDLNQVAAELLATPIEECLQHPIIRLLGRHAQVDAFFLPGGPATLEVGFQDGTRHCKLSIRRVAEPLCSQKLKLLTLRDITEQVRLRAALAQSEERFDLSAMGSQDGLWDWDLRSQTMYFSPRWKEIAGLEKCELGGSPDEWFSRVHPEDLQQFKNDLDDHIKGLTPMLENEHRIGLPSGEHCWVKARAMGVAREGKMYLIAGSLTDISDRKQDQTQKRQLALRDQLTGLYNRTMFGERLAEALRRSVARRDYRFAVLHLDLDRFKAINDRHGHTFGDKLLAAIAGRLRTSLRTPDTLARLGGDEFAILLEEIHDSAEGRHVAQRLMKVVARACEVEGQPITATASIGIAFSGPSYSQPEQILRDAEIAMYRAKNLGRAQAVLFTQDMADRSMSMLDREMELILALEEEQFELYYQPIVLLKQQGILGLEALLRWNHPQRGLLEPESFLSSAEATDLIYPLGYWVLDQVCKCAAAWQQELELDPPLSVSVNLTRKQLEDPELLNRLRQSLYTAGLAPSSLILELAESDLLKDLDLFTQILVQIKEVGVQLYLDKFGEHYSSLSALGRLPIDMIKIDRSLTTRILVGDRNLQLLRSIVELGSQLGKGVVAGGIEDQQINDRLKGIDLAFGQGYFFTHPLPGEAVGAFLHSYLLTRQAIAAGGSEGQS